MMCYMAQCGNVKNFPIRFVKSNKRSRQVNLDKKLNKPNFENSDVNVFYRIKRNLDGSIYVSTTYTKHILTNV